MLIDVAKNPAERFCSRRSADKLIISDDDKQLASARKRHIDPRNFAQEPRAQVIVGTCNRKNDDISLSPLNGVDSTALNVKVREGVPRTVHLSFQELHLGQVTA